MLLRSLPFREPDRLAFLHQFIPPHDTAKQVHEWSQQSAYLADAAVFEEIDANLGGTRIDIRAHVAQASWNFFSMRGREILVLQFRGGRERLERNFTSIVNANYARYIERTSYISPLSRFVATPSDTGGKVACPPEKIYSFFLRGLAEAASRKHHSRPGNCLSLVRWVTGHKLSLGRKADPRSHMKMARSEKTMVNDINWRPFGRLRGRIINPFMIKRSNFMANDDLRSARRFVGTV